jgi:DNA-binding transcriptional regulator YhcF (GntR family)
MSVLSSRGPRAAPIADSLAEALARQIASGAYKAGDKLPSLRGGEQG